jgi:hypothetical protein
MSVGAAASLSRVIATPTPGSTAVAAADDPQPQALPQTITDAQGREFTLQQDPVSGHPQYRHAEEQHDATGSSLTLEILIDLAQDGSYSRRTTQHLALATGDSQHEVVLDSFAADGTQVGEQVESRKQEGAAVTTEKTTGTYAAGQLVRRETDVVQSDEATDATSHERTTVGSTIHGVWDNGGQPITDDTIPTVDRNDTQAILTPGQGINKDTDRTLTFTRHAAGPVNALDWDDAGKLVVRFDGHKGQYIERELKVPLDQASGDPDMAHAETVRTDDHENLVNKGLMQARVWGGLASNLSWIVGVNFAKGGLGKAFLGLSAVASGAQLIGETHAVATKRNDGDWTRVATSAYDVLLTGMLAAYMSGNKGFNTQALSAGQRLGFSAAGIAGASANGANLLGANPVGVDAFTARSADAKLGVGLARPTTALDRDWRLEPRFDAASALLD